MSHSQSVSLSTRIIQCKREFEATVYGQLDTLKRNCSGKKAQQLCSGRVAFKQSAATETYTQSIPVTCRCSEFPFLPIESDDDDDGASVVRGVVEQCVQQILSVCVHSCDASNETRKHSQNNNITHSLVCVCVVLFQVHDISSTARFVI